VRRQQLVIACWLDWPVSAVVNTHPANQGFGSYMNGGSFLGMTSWEVVEWPDHACAGWRGLR
jgi:hypothetical protein